MKRHTSSRCARVATAFVICLVFVSSAWTRDGVLPSVKSRTSHLPFERPAGVPSDTELEAAGARIGDVLIDPMNIFDTSRPEEDTALFRLANHLHIRTRKDTVREQLLFHGGELYQGRLLGESERILRGTRYLQDASIRPVAYHDGLVDIEVVTNDVWTLNPGVSFGRKGGKNTSGFKLEDLNLLGLGSQVSLGRSSGVDRTSTTLRYVDQQFLGSWWTIAGEYSDNSDGRTEEFQLEKPFYALDTQHAYGLHVKRDERVDSLYDLGEIVDQFATQERSATVYKGWSRGLHDGWVRRFSAGFTYDESTFTPVVGESGPTTLLPADRKLSYPWMSYEWIQDDFEKTRNRDQIEKTEDVHLGMRASVRLGYSASAFGGDRNAVIFGGEFSRGFEPDERQRLLLAASLTGRVEGSTAEDTLAGLSARYYFRQSERRLLFLGAVADLGKRLDLDHSLTLGGDNGLRGYPLRYQGGSGRWVMTAEERFFTNWYPFRLINVGGAVFYDMGRTWGDNPYGTPSKGLLRDVGFGLRLGNSRSALGNVLHVDIAFPLDGDKSISSLQFLVQTQRSF
jgi:outer membrane protein assembly factor BamA